MNAPSSVPQPYWSECSSWSWRGTRWRWSSPPRLTRAAGRWHWPDSAVFRSGPRRDTAWPNRSCCSRWPFRSEGCWRTPRSGSWRTGSWHPRHRCGWIGRCRQPWRSPSPGPSRRSCSHRAAPCGGPWSTNCAGSCRRPGSVGSSPVRPSCFQRPPSPSTRSCNSDRRPPSRGSACWRPAWSRWPWESPPAGWSSWVRGAGPGGPGCVPASRPSWHPARSPAATVWPVPPS